MLIRTCAASTGGAGIIETIRMFVGHHWVAAILCTIALVGWVMQGLGSAFYYRQVRTEQNDIARGGALTT